MESIWSASAFPPAWSVLRLKLKPYCPGHEINLCQIQSPFALGGEVDFKDLVTAALICSQTFEEGQRTIINPPELFCWLWGKILKWTMRQDMFPVELAKFRGYLNAGRWAPETNIVIAKGVEMRTLKAPRVYRLVPFLCSHLGLTESQALNFPMARANAYVAALADQDGKIDLQGDDREKALMDYKARMEALGDNGENVWGS